jgi:hypothetical protein
MYRVCIEYLFRDFKEYYVCTIHYAFIWAFHREAKLLHQLPSSVNSNTFYYFDRLCDFLICRIPPHIAFLLHNIKSI